MRKLRITFLIGITAMLLYSCQKEFSEENGDNPPALDSNLVLLKKYIRLDTTLTSPNDTVFTASYNYDQFGRCTSILYKYFDHPDALYEGIVQETIFYNGSDTTMAYRTMVNTSSSGTINEKEYFTYDASGRIIKDSVVHEGTDASFYYRYDGDVIHTVAYFAGTPTDSTFYTTHDIQKTNGNIVVQKDSSYDVNGIWPYPLEVVDSTVSQYDTHPNPLYRTGAPWHVLSEIEHVLDGELLRQQKNNRISFYGRFVSGGIDDIDQWTFQYIYLTNGYPSAIRIHNNFNGEDHYYKDLYVY